MADAHHSNEVTAVVVAAGPLSGIESPLLTQAFSVARAGTIAENATLEVEDMPVIVWCESCAIETPAAANALLCGRCGTWKVTLRSGNELLLKRVELVPAENTAAAATG